MQLKYLRTLLEGQVRWRRRSRSGNRNSTHISFPFPALPSLQEHIQRIAGLAWSPNQQKLAIATADRHILLYDDAGERRDKFSTKPANAANGKNSYVIRGLAFSPDSTKLAVGQSDSIVYVYKLGESWNDKKVICNKFPQAGAVTALIWLSSGAIIAGNAQEFLFLFFIHSFSFYSSSPAGLEDGKVRALHCKSNKSQSLYGGDSICISLAANTKGNGFLSGHNDGTIIRYFMTDEASEPLGRVVQHPVPPFALAWPQGGFCAGGCDQRIIFYDSVVSVEGGEGGGNRKLYFLDLTDYCSS